MSSKYEKEKYNPPTKTHVEYLKLEFDGSSLTFFAKDKIYKYSAVSGFGRGDKFCYCKTIQNREFHGPIPEGNYWIKLSELWERGLINTLADNFIVTYDEPDVTTEETWGNYRILIHPFKNTKTGPRGGFFIHGGTWPRSLGCIDLALNMDRFVKDLKEETKDLPVETHLHLKVSYFFQKPCDKCVEFQDIRNVIYQQRQ